MGEPDGEPSPPTEPENPAPALPFEFPTEALLDDHVAAADELRADLDQLRRQLDDGPPPLTPPRRRRRPPITLLSVLAALVLLAVAILAPWSDLGFGRSPAGSAQSAGTEAAGTLPAGPGSASPGSAGPGSAGTDRSSTGPAPEPALVPATAPAGSLPTTGPGIDRPGTMMLVRVDENGSLNVIEQAVLGPQGLPRIDLRLPSLASLGGQVAELAPIVQGLRAAVNGTPVTVTSTDDGPGWTVAGGNPTRTVRLSYRLEGTIVRSQPSRAGRALGVSLPLLGQALRAQGSPLVVRAEGPAVGGVTCPSAPTTQMLCGQPSGNGWLATIPATAASPVLLLQLDFP